MRQSGIHIISRWVAASTLLLATACSDKMDFATSRIAGEGEEKAVSFTVQPQIQAGQMRTRAAEDSYQSISDGKKIDALIYAVYQSKDGGNTFELVVNKTPADSLTASGPVGDDGEGGHDHGNEYGHGTSYVKGVKAGPGQTVLNFKEEAGGSNSLTIDLTIRTDRQYKVVFWAESSLRADVYDTYNLEKVHVSYDGALNNDELRDAFCGVLQFSGAEMAENIKNNKKTYYTVHLHRPFAQINVGAAGWDYEGAAILKPAPVGYTRSTIKLGGVAQYYNVVEGRALVTGNDGSYPLTNAEFGFDFLPAFINVDKPTDEEAYKNWSPAIYTPLEEEEYLCVDLNDDGKLVPYRGWVNGTENNWNIFDFDDKNPPKTEKFKYISMGYVLVPEATTSNGGFGSSTLNSVEFHATGQSILDDEEVLEDADEPEDAPEGDVEGKDKDNSETVDDVEFIINNVPVQKNWRTNILVNNFFVYHEQFTIDIVPDYCGSYDDSEGNKNDENTWPIEGGKYYAVSFGNARSETYSNDGENINSVFSSVSGDYSTKYGTGKYTSKNVGTLTFSEGLKLNSAIDVAFTTKVPATVIIVHSAETKGTKCNRGIRITDVNNSIDMVFPLDSALQPEGSENVYVHILELPDGNYKIKRQEETPTEGALETGLFYVEVIYPTSIDDDTIHGDNDFEYKDNEVFGGGAEEEGEGNDANTEGEEENTDNG